MAGRPLSLRLARNAAFNLLGRLWFVGAWVCITPYVLKQLGAERFGVWSLLFLLSGYLATFDLGLGSSIVRFTAQHATQDDWQGLRATMSAILRVYLVLGIVWVLGILLSEPWLLRWLRISPAYESEVRFALTASAIVFAFANLVSTGTGVLNGLQRMDLANGILIGSSIPQIGLLAWGLHLGYGLYAVAVSTATSWIFTAVATWVAISRLAPQLGWPWVTSRGKSSGWIRFSTWMQVNNVIALSQQQLDKILLTARSGLRAVAEFELGFRVTNALQSMPMVILSPLIPAFAELEASGERDRFLAVCRRGQSLLTGGSFWLIAAAVPALPFVIRAWVGAEYALAGRLAQWMMAAFALNLCTGIGTAAVRGAGRPDIEVLPGVAAVIVHVIASWFWIGWRGPDGAGPAMLLAMFIWTASLLWRFVRWLGQPMSAFLGPAFGPALVALLPGLAAGFLLERWVPVSWSASRIGALGGACLVAAGGAAVFGIIWWPISRWADQVWRLPTPIVGEPTTS